MTWAPQCNISVVFIFFICIIIRIIRFETEIFVAGLAYLGLELFSAIIADFQMSSAVLHLLGVAVGLLIGLLAVSRDWIDCDGFDIISTFKGQVGEESDAVKRRVAAEETAKNAELREVRKDRAAEGREQIEKYMSEGNPLFGRLLARERQAVPKTPTR